jgi:hypothetical protein
MESLGKAAYVSRAELALNEREQAYDHKVSKANKRFAKANAATKRVIIAKDVITWLNIGKLKPAPGIYLRSKFAFDPVTNQAWAYGDDAPYELRSRLLRVEGTPTEDNKVNGDTCAACALGGLFACAVERADGLKDLIEVRPDDRREFWMAGQEAMHTYLAPFFDLKQLLLIESAFERSDFVCDGMWTSWNREHDDDPSKEVRNEWKAEGLAAAEKFRHIAAPSDRMRAIMENVIANGGTFVV